MNTGSRYGPNPTTSNQIVLAITGASGSVYAVRLAQVMLQTGLHLHVVISTAARHVLRRELGCDAPGDSDSGQTWRNYFETTLETGPAAEWNLKPLQGAESSEYRQFMRGGEAAGSVRVWSSQDFSAGIASGSFRTRGMVICPCSMGTLSSIACGASMNLIQRAADVHLKERRPLIVVPRETPLGLIALENMVRLTQAGAIVMPAMPGYYHQPQSVGDLVDFVVGRICDHLHIEHSLTQRWGDTSE